MPDESSASVLQSALCGTTSSRLSALRALQSTIPPKSFLKYLLTHLPDPPLLEPAVHLIRLLPDDELSKGFFALAASFRAQPPGPRTSLVYVRAGAALCRCDSLQKAALDLVLSAIVSIERGSTSRGPSLRSHTRALSTAYAVARRHVSNNGRCVTALFVVAERGDQAPFEALAALGVLSPAVDVLPRDQRTRFLFAATNLCVKAGVDIARRVVSIVSFPLLDGEWEHESSEVVTILEKALLRAPEIAFPVATCLLGALKVDLSEAIWKRFLPTMKQAITSADGKSRANAVELAAVAGARLKGSDALVSGVISLCAFLKTARYVYQKVAAIEAISGMACAEADVERSVETILMGVEVAVDGIRTWLISKKETNVEARSAAIRALVKLVSTALTFVDDEAGVPPNVKSCASVFVNILRDVSDVDRHALLAGLTADLPGSALPAEFLGELGFAAMQSVIVMLRKTMHENCLRALAVVLKWSQERANEGLGGKTPPDVLDCDMFAAIVNPRSCTSQNLVHCALWCCSWAIERGHVSSTIALATLFELCLDSRRNISSFAVRKVRSLRKCGTDPESMFMVLWDTQFCAPGGNRSVAKSHDCDDGMRTSERLGKTLFAVVLPDVPEAIIPLVLLAANHPRLCQTPQLGRRPQRSRYWIAIESRLNPARKSLRGDTKDWLEQSLQIVFREIRSADSGLAEAAVNAIWALADYRNEYSDHIVQRALTSLRPVALSPTHLGTDALDALEIVREAEVRRSETSDVVAEGSASVPRRVAKKKGGAAKHRSNQEKQAESDRARAAQANAIAAKQKTDAARAKARMALEAFRLSRSALRAFSALALVAPRSVHRRCDAILPLILPLAQYGHLEGPCRDALSTLAYTAGKRLGPLSADIGVSLYGLNRKLDVSAPIANVINNLVCLVPPVLGVEDFCLIMPIIRAALIGNGDIHCERSENLSRARLTAERREAAALSKSSARLLAEHCKAGAIDTALAAAASYAGSWAVQALEREDGAFEDASDVLTFLTSNVLTPGTAPLRQVLEAVTSGKAAVRDSALTALSCLPQLSSSTVACPRDAELARALWLARFDPDEANSELAHQLWTNYNHPLHVQEDVRGIITFLDNSVFDVRLMCAKAIAVALCGNENEGAREVCIPQVLALYMKKIPVDKLEDLTLRDAGRSPGPVDSSRLGREKAQIPIDDGWDAREGVALTIEEMASNDSLDEDSIRVCFGFLVHHGLRDKNETVRLRMARAALAVVHTTGPLAPSILLPLLEKELDMPSNDSVAELNGEHRKEHLVTCLGAVAAFLPSDDSRVSRIGEQVIRSSLESSSEAIQNAAARCLAPLAMTCFEPGRREEVTDRLVKMVAQDDLGYARRRGAAYALAGICKGLGLRSFKRLNIMEHIETAVADKSPRRRQGGLLIFEAQSVLMHRAFEPYAVALLPQLLLCMGDSAIDVRNACWAASQAALSQISSQGVRMVLPSLLTALNDKQWRTKAGSAEVLGTVAFCAPRQLSQCLPQVVPRLSEALSDAHPRVVDAAESAINRIAAIVKSPEVRMLSPFLLAAFRDPAGKTRGAIDAMLGCEFVHTIDVASLALLIPPLHRGLRERSSELKKRSAAIVGSMCNNVSNHLDVLPYLDLLLPALQVTLLDSNPDVRRTAARALGVLAGSLGEDGLPDIVAWLVQALLKGIDDSRGNGISGQQLVGLPTAVSSKSERHGEKLMGGPAVISSSAERSGAALGLAEVAASLDDGRFESVLNTVLKAGQYSADAREGGLMLIAALPKALGTRFESRLETALSVILQGLADDSDNVREAALDAGRSVVSAYAETSLNQLLPVILSAMRDKLWRIRSAATRLLGDMLCVIAKTPQQKTDALAPNVEGDEELSEAIIGDNSAHDTEGNGLLGDESEELFTSPEQAAAAVTTDATLKAIENILGFQRRNEILAALYIVRCDVSLRVRQTGMQVWKTIVSNTPRVLREIMPSAVSQIVDGLGDEDDERRAAAGKTLGDLCQKLGDHIVPEVLPVLNSAITDKQGSERIRRGAIEGLGELVLSCPKEQLEDHTVSLLEAVYEGLCDNLPVVRVAAASVFSFLLRPLGSAPVDYFVSQFMSRLSAKEEDTELALDAMREVLEAGGSRLLSILVPRLLHDQPIRGARARALAIAAGVPESSFEPYAVDVAKAVLRSMALMEDEVVRDMESVLSAIASSGIRAVDILLEEVTSHFRSGTSGCGVAAARTCAAFCRSANTEIVAAACGKLLAMLIQQLSAADVETTESTLEALKELSNAVSPSTLSAHIPILRQSLRATSTAITRTDDLQLKFGMNLAKAWVLFAAILANGLLHGEPELREQAALCIGEYVELAAMDNLRSFVFKITGPLIRVLSDRFQWQVKAAVLKALLVLLKSSPRALRTFAPQLQSTVVKNLGDCNQLVRKRACATLGALMPILPRVEGLLNDLVGQSQSESSDATRATMFYSCAQVFRFATSLPPTAFSRVPLSILAGLSGDSEEVQTAAACAMVYLANRVEDCSLYMSLLQLILQPVQDVDVAENVQIAVLKAIGIVYSAGKDVEGLGHEHVVESVNYVCRMLQSGVSELSCAACRTGADFVSLLAPRVGLSDSCEEDKLEVVTNICRLAESGPGPMVRVAALNAIKVVILIDSQLMRACSRSIMVCASETDSSLRSHTDQLMRQVFMQETDDSPHLENVAQAKLGLSKAHARLLDRRISNWKMGLDANDRGLESDSEAPEQ